MNILLDIETELPKLYEWFGEKPISIGRDAGSVFFKDKNIVGYGGFDPKQRIDFNRCMSEDLKKFFKDSRNDLRCARGHLGNMADFWFNDTAHNYESEAYINNEIDKFLKD